MTTNAWPLTFLQLEIWPRSQASPVFRFAFSIIYGSRRGPEHKPKNKKKKMGEALKQGLVQGERWAGLMN